MRQLLIRVLLVAAPVVLVLALPISTGSQSSRNDRTVSRGTALRIGGELGGPYRNGLIAFARGGGVHGLYVIRPDGTGERQIFRPPFGSDIPLSPAWSPDGKWIAFVPGPPRNGVWMMHANGSNLRRITIGRGIPQDPSWSPNGKWIAFADRHSPRSDSHDIYVVRTNGSGLKRLTRAVVDEVAPAWGPNGEIVFAGNHGLWRMRPDGSGKRLLARGVGQVSWSPGGSRMAFTRSGDPWTMKRDGTDAKPVAQIEGDQNQVAWSPDSHWLVMDSVGRSDLMLVRSDGSEIHPLTNRSDIYNMWPTWQRLPR
jgi:dipeptidyl aminopeptidase/acylaminoacyl peptidase